MSILLRRGQKVLFIGDSITDCGRRLEHRPLGAGYVRMAIDLIEARYPGREMVWINRGIGGNTVRNLTERWTDDCVRHQPDWISIMIGINDLNQWVTGGDGSVPPDEYEVLYNGIISRACDETNARLILVLPFYMSTISPGDETEHHRGRMAAGLITYSRVVERLARRYGAILVRPQKAFDLQFQTRDPNEFCDEPVHPNASGHLLIAHTWLTAVGW
jgi:lysophospholipase L1-like esterase